MYTTDDGSTIENDPEAAKLCGFALNLDVFGDEPEQTENEDVQDKGDMTDEGAEQDDEPDERDGDFCETDDVSDSTYGQADGETVDEDDEIPTEEHQAAPTVRPYVRATQDHIHIASERNTGLARLVFQYGFACADFGAGADMRDIYESIHASQAVLVEAPEDITQDTRLLSYQVREGIAAGKDVLILCERTGGEFLNKFENQPHVRIVCARAGRDVLHGVFIEFLCKYNKAWNRADCRDDAIGELVAHGIDASLGYAASEHFLAERYAAGELLPKSESAAMHWYNSARDHGSVRATVSLGDCYFSGSICPQNRKKAYDLYCEVADQDYPMGLFKKGACLLEGDGCEADPEQAYRCFKRTTELDSEHVEAYYYLGLCYKEGWGVDVSRSEAKACLRKSAKGEYVPAIIALGNIFSDAEDDEYNETLAYDCFNKAAQAGDAEGMYKRGMSLSSGKGCEKDADLAFESFLAGAEQKHSGCAHALGMCYEFGLGCDIDYERAYECYKLAAGLGSAEATNNLGGCYLYGHGVIKDTAYALELFEKAAQMGDSNAAARLGLLYEEGNVVEKNLKTAFGYYTKAAASNATAAFRLGHFYRQGVGTLADIERSTVCFEHAASLGHIEAMFCTACAYMLGLGVEKDEWSAYRWFCAGAQRGHGQSYYEMGNCCFKGTGTAKNPAKAIYCYKKAYELGASEAEAALRIGICLLRGLGAEKDSAGALEWLKISAQGECADAQFLCGECALYGVGCAKDPELAAQYYIAAAKQDHVRAIMALAECCETGVGRKASAAKAMQLYEKATLLGSAEAYYKLGRLTLETRSSLQAASPMFFKAANKGYIPAILTLGILYDKGQGIPENTDKAIEKYTQVMSEGTKKSKTVLFALPEREQERQDRMLAAVTDATYRLGMLRGRLAKSAEEYGNAFECIASAAAMGAPEAQREIARISQLGGELSSYFKTDRGELPDPDRVQIADAMNKLGDNWYEGKKLLRKNDRAAVKCFRLAAQMGQIDACYSLGWCLRHGVGTAVDDVEAAKWLKFAADKGNPYAAYSFGLCCEEGSGMENPNIKEALSYYRKAAASGHSEAKKRYLKISRDR